MPIREERFTHYAQFISEFSKILFPPNGTFKRDRYLFRGQGSHNYNLISKFDRAFSSLTPVERVKRYDKLIAHLKDEYKRIGQVLTNEDDYTGLAQHFGIPTRMLDWTSSPLVASYFAFHERVMKPSSDKYVSIWALNRADTDVWNPHNGVEIVELQSPSNNRASRQLGFATKLRSTHDKIENMVKALNPGRTVLWKFDIDAGDAESAFAFLDASNVRATELFGDVEGAARTALERIYLEFGP